MLILDIQKRQKTGSKSSRALLVAGSLPSVLYGRDMETVSVFVNKDKFGKVWKEAGESSLVTLKGLEETKTVLIRDVDIDPVSDEPRHVDFYAVSKGQKVRVWVPVEFEGVSPAVKELGGTLVKVLHELEVEAEPDKLPHNILVDISALVDFDSQITVENIKLPEGVEAMAEEGDVVALVSESKEEDLESSAEMDLSAIEVEKKGKEEVAEEGEAST